MQIRNVFKQKASLDFQCYQSVSKDSVSKLQYRLHRGEPTSFEKMWPLRQLLSCIGCHLLCRSVNTERYHRLEQKDVQKIESNFLKESPEKVENWKYICILYKKIKKRQGRIPQYGIHKYAPQAVPNSRKSNIK